jgi:hypothetical protein
MVVVLLLMLPPVLLLLLVLVLALVLVLRAASCPSLPPPPQDIALAFQESSCFFTTHAVAPTPPVPPLPPLSRPPRLPNQSTNQPTRSLGWPAPASTLRTTTTASGEKDLLLGVAAVVAVASAA